MAELKQMSSSLKFETERDFQSVKANSNLKPGNSMVMMFMSQEDYEIHYWPRLQNAIHQLLTLCPGEYAPISYEQMYSCVYKCVCKQFSERLYSDLIQHITLHLQHVSNDLEVSKQGGFNIYLIRFDANMKQYMQALEGIVPIFNYMNRFYIESKLYTDLRSELLKVFTVYVAEPHISCILMYLVEALSKPFSIHPAIMQSIVKGLYTLKPEFSHLKPQLFAKFIPNVYPPTSIGELPSYIEETLRIQRELEHIGFSRGDCSRKRPGDDDIIRNPLFPPSTNHNNF